MKLYTSLAAFSVLILLACSTNRKSRISAPSAELDIPFQIHRFQADSGTTFRLSTGTQIRIEPGSLVDSKGNVVHGSVEFRVREFHTAEDLFRSGVPMDTRANGTERLQTGGMIEMRAYAGKEELNMAAGKTIGVELAGFRDANGYDLWYMEENSDWNKNGKFTIDSNRIKIQAIQAITDTLNKMRAPANDDRRMFELVTNLKEAPYLRAYSGLKWRLDDSQPIELLEVQSRVNWEAVKIVPINRKNNLYQLTFTQFEKRENGKVGMQQTILAQALTSRADMKKRSATYEKDLLAFEEELARRKREADLVQSFRADRLGIWNVDKLLKMENCSPVYVHFDFEKELNEMATSIRLFALYDGENSIAEYPKEKWDKVYLQKGKAMRLIAVLPKNQLAIVSNETIQSVLQGSPKEIFFKTERKSAKGFLETASR
jgi:hypothetical protein